jgi:ubiquinone biosynthesis UbiH/UbiF/VisC/COQ6 family hydroxylase
MSRGLSICVVGGGVAGTACALRLAEAGHRVSLLAGPEPVAAGPTEEEIRYYALSPASLAALDALGVAAEGCPYTDMRVWGSAIRDGLYFSLADAPPGSEALGRIVGHGALAAALRQRAESVLRVLPVSASGVTLGDHGVEIDCADGDLLTADLVVAADGARSALREAAGIAITSWGYAQQGIVANVQVAAGMQATAWQRFLPDGVLALLPLDARRASIVWSADGTRAETLMGMDPASFGAALTEATQQVLGAITVESRRAAFPLQALQAERYCGERLALVGDAAHVVHPLAGQGLNLGLADAGALAMALAEHPLQLSRALAAYSRRRRAATADMIAVTDGLHRLFNRTGPEFAELRDAGMALVNRIRPLRRLLVERALGGEAAPVPTPLAD